MHCVHIIGVSSIALEEQKGEITRRYMNQRLMQAMISVTLLKERNLTRFKLGPITNLNLSCPGQKEDAVSNFGTL